MIHLLDEDDGCGGIVNKPTSVCFVFADGYFNLISSIFFIIIIINIYIFVVENKNKKTRLKICISY